MKDHENTKFIQDITFQQIKMATREANARLNSFDKQFSGCHKNLNNGFLGRQKTSTSISNSKKVDYQSFDCIEVIV